MTWHVRPYEPIDAAECCGVINSAVSVMDGLNGAARAHVRASNVPERLGPDLGSWTTLVVESDLQRIVGIGSLDRDEIGRVYVDPAIQGRWVAQVLMAELEARARAAGIKKIRLDASPSSLEFYEYIGYESHGRGGFDIDEATFRFVHMTKDLSEGSKSEGK